MEFIVYLFSASLLFWGVATMLAYKRTRYYGVFLLGLTYTVSAVLAAVLLHWWPLVAGIALAWVLRFLGLDPDVKKDETEQSVKE